MRVTLDIDVEVLPEDASVAEVAHVIAHLISRARVERSLLHSIEPRLVTMYVTAVRLAAPTPTIDPDDLEEVPR